MIGSSTLQDGLVAIVSDGIKSEIFEVYNNARSMLFKIKNETAFFSRTMAIMFGDDINPTDSQALGWQATSSDMLSIYPAPVNMATATPTVVSNYEPQQITAVTAVNYFSTYSDDINRILVWSSANAGSCRLKRNSLSSATAADSSIYIGSNIQTISAVNVNAGVANSAFRGMITSGGYHYAMVASTSALTYIKRATSSFSNDISLAANWSATSTIVGRSLVNTDYIAGVNNGNIYLVISDTQFAVMQISTTTNTLTQIGTTTISASAKMKTTPYTSRVNENGLYEVDGAVPYVRKYNTCSGTCSASLDNQYGNGMGAATPSTTGPSNFVMKRSYYSLNESTNVLSKIYGW